MTAFELNDAYTNFESRDISILQEFELRLKTEMNCLLSYEDSSEASAELNYAVNEFAGALVLKEVLLSESWHMYPITRHFWYSDFPFIVLSMNIGRK